MIKDSDLLTGLIDSVENFVSERLIPNENQVEELDEVPSDILQEMREMGLFGLALPEEYGGLGLTQEEEVLVTIELSKTSPAFRSVVATNNGIGSQGIVIDGTEEQKQTAEILKKPIVQQCIKLGASQGVACIWYKEYGDPQPT